MGAREAACHCGQLRLEVSGEPMAVSICNCLGTPAPAGKRLRDAGGPQAHQVEVTGRFNDYTRNSDEADGKEHVFHFCPDCGSQVFYTEPSDRT